MLLTAILAAVRLVVWGRRRTTLISRLGDGSLCPGIAAAKVQLSYGLCKDVAEANGILKSQQPGTQCVTTLS